VLGPHSFSQAGNTFYVSNDEQADGDHVERYLLQDQSVPAYQPTRTIQQQPYDYSPVQYLSDFPSKEEDYETASTSSRSGKSFDSLRDTEPFNPVRST